MVEYNEQAVDEWDRKVAVMFIGNKGVGKSTLLSQLGGNFKSGFSFMEGITKDASEQEVNIGGQPTILIDVPGLYDTTEKGTRINSKKLTEALNLGYHYKLFFVLAGNSRGISDEDLVLMFRVNEAISDAMGSKVEFWLIVNRIHGEKELQEYERHLTPESFQKDLFQIATAFGTHPVDIRIRGIVLLRYDEKAVENRGFYHRLLPCVMAQIPVRLKVKQISASVGDISLIKKIVITLSSLGLLTTIVLLAVL
ncbi:hypothetical protein BGW38_006436 [Lunasporangiospora selenospora]|uniref:G domain-containing protein n=1 Tax=Lunasporangiospora selenospora TaxID=979761 RepID=A0A9P6KH24_9FUNG|nr:hypothetical protein BGW38_006436 [Lunasporangiospora selenospora]